MILTYINTGAGEGKVETMPSIGGRSRGVFSDKKIIRKTKKRTGPRGGAACGVARSRGGNEGNSHALSQITKKKKSTRGVEGESCWPREDTRELAWTVVSLSSFLGEDCLGWLLQNGGFGCCGLGCCSAPPPLSFSFSHSRTTGLCV